jgi:hypothetical protein
VEMGTSADRLLIDLQEMFSRYGYTATDRHCVFD